ncbi:Ubiquinol oxidase 1, mitochondrial [Capsicum annuum]|nr:Ubiquinol oxidase 1, mitochondrial [Capsicum annuum]KAF3667861.1 Ubiquinol oxidase 1, mitochondrial [Capsicum annuum]
MIGSVAGIGVITDASGILHGNSIKDSEKMMVTYVRYLSIINSHNASNMTLSDKEQNDQNDRGNNNNSNDDDDDDDGDDVSYWGYTMEVLQHQKIEHRSASDFELLQRDFPCILQRRYDYHAMMLEIVAAVPGMVGEMLLHCKSLRRFENSDGWIKALLEEAENERMNLMTFMEVSKPKWYERALVIVLQGIFFNAYFMTYLLSPKLAHRIVGYLEEEAIHSYTEFLKELEMET